MEVCINGKEDHSSALQHNDKCLACAAEELSILLNGESTAGSLVLAAIKVLLCEGFEKFTKSNEPIPPEVYKLAFWVGQRSIGAYYFNWVESTMKKYQQDGPDRDKETFAPFSMVPSIDCEMVRLILVEALNVIARKEDSHDGLTLWVEEISKVCVVASSSEQAHSAAISNHFVCILHFLLQHRGFREFVVTHHPARAESLIAFLIELGVLHCDLVLIQDTCFGGVDFCFTSPFDGFAWIALRILRSNLKSLLTVKNALLNILAAVTSDKQQHKDDMLLFWSEVARESLLVTTVLEIFGAFNNSHLHRSLQTSSHQELCALNEKLCQILDQVLSSPVTSVEGENVLLDEFLQCRALAFLISLLNASDSTSSVFVALLGSLTSILVRFKNGIQSVNENSWLLDDRGESDTRFLTARNELKSLLFPTFHILQAGFASLSGDEKETQGEAYSTTNHRLLQIAKCAFTIAAVLPETSILPIGLSIIDSFYDTFLKHQELVCIAVLQFLGGVAACGNKNAEEEEKNTTTDATLTQRFALRASDVCHTLLLDKFNTANSPMSYAFLDVVTSTLQHLCHHELTLVRAIQVISNSNYLTLIAQASLNENNGAVLLPQTVVQLLIDLFVRARKNEVLIESPENVSNPLAGMQANTTVKQAACLFALKLQKSGFIRDNLEFKHSIASQLENKVHEMCTEILITLDLFVEEKNERDRDGDCPAVSMEERLHSFANNNSSSNSLENVALLAGCFLERDKDSFDGEEEEKMHFDALSEAIYKFEENVINGTERYGHHRSVMVVNSFLLFTQHIFNHATWCGVDEVKQSFPNLLKFFSRAIFVKSAKIVPKLLKAVTWRSLDLKSTVVFLLQQFAFVLLENEREAQVRFLAREMILRWGVHDFVDALVNSEKMFHSNGCFFLSALVQSLDSDWVIHKETEGSGSKTMIYFSSLQKAIQTGGLTVGNYPFFSSSNKFAMDNILLVYGNHPSLDYKTEWELKFGKALYEAVAQRLRKVLAQMKENDPLSCLDLVSLLFSLSTRFVPASQCFEFCIQTILPRLEREKILSTQQIISHVVNMVARQPLSTRRKFYCEDFKWIVQVIIANVRSQPYAAAQMVQSVILAEAFGVGDVDGFTNTQTLFDLTELLNKVKLHHPRMFILNSLSDVLTRRREEQVGKIFASANFPPGFDIINRIFKGASIALFMGENMDEFFFKDAALRCVCLIVSQYRKKPGLFTMQNAYQRLVCEDSVQLLSFAVVKCTGCLAFPTVRNVRVTPDNEDEEVIQEILSQVLNNGKVTTFDRRVVSGLILLSVYFALIHKPIGDDLKRSCIEALERLKNVKAFEEIQETYHITNSFIDLRRVEKGKWKTSMEQLLQFVFGNYDAHRVNFQVCQHLYDFSLCNDITLIDCFLSNLLDVLRGDVPTTVTLPFPMVLDKNGNLLRLFEEEEDSQSAASIRGVDLTLSASQMFHLDVVKSAHNEKERKKEQSLRGMDANRVMPYMEFKDDEKEKTRQKKSEEVAGRSFSIPPPHASAKEKLEFLRSAIPDVEIYEMPKGFDPTQPKFQRLHPVNKLNFPRSLIADLRYGEAKMKGELAADNFVSKIQSPFTTKEEMIQLSEGFNAPLPPPYLLSQTPGMTLEFVPGTRIAAMRGPNKWMLTKVVRSYSDGIYVVENAADLRMEPKIDTFQVFIVPKIWTVELAAVVEESEEEEMELVKEKTIGNVDPIAYNVNELVWALPSFSPSFFCVGKILETIPRKDHAGPRKRRSAAVNTTDDDGNENEVKDFRVQFYEFKENGALFEGSVELVKWENVFSNARPRKGNEVKVVLFSDLTKLDDGDAQDEEDGDERVVEMGESDEEKTEPIQPAAPPMGRIPRKRLVANRPKQISIVPDEEVVTSSPNAVETVVGAGIVPAAYREVYDAYIESYLRENNRLINTFPEDPVRGSDGKFACRHEGCTFVANICSKVKRHEANAHIPRPISLAEGIYCATLASKNLSFRFIKWGNEKKEYAAYFASPYDAFAAGYKLCIERGWEPPKLRKLSEFGIDLQSIASVAQEESGENAKEREEENVEKEKEGKGMRPRVTRSRVNNKKSNEEDDDKDEPKKEKKTNNNNNNNNKALLLSPKSKKEKEEEDQKLR